MKAVSCSLPSESMIPRFMVSSSSTCCAIASKGFLYPKALATFLPQKRGSSLQTIDAPQVAKIQIAKSIVSKRGDIKYQYQLTCALLLMDEMFMYKIHIWVIRYTSIYNYINMPLYIGWYDWSKVHRVTDIDIWYHSLKCDESLLLLPHASDASAIIQYRRCGAQKSPLQHITNIAAISYTRTTKN